MKDVNKVMLLGRLGTDPVQRETKNGVDVTHFSLATSRRVTNSGSKAAEVTASEMSDEGEMATDSLPNLRSLKNPERPEETQWHQVVAWGKLAQICAQHLKKGQTAFVTGELRTRKYTTKNGDERLSVEIHAEEVSFLGRKLAPMLGEAASA